MAAETDFDLVLTEFGHAPTGVKNGSMVDKCNEFNEFMIPARQNSSVKTNQENGTFN